MVDLRDLVETDKVVRRDIVLTIHLRRENHFGFSKRVSVQGGRSEKLALPSFFIL